MNGEGRPKAAPHAHSEGLSRSGTPEWSAHFHYLVRLEATRSPFLAETVTYGANVVTARGCFASAVSGWPTCADADGTIEPAQYERYYGALADYTFPLMRVRYVKTLGDDRG